MQSTADDRCSKEVVLLSGNTNHFEGIVYAPRGRIGFRGSDLITLLGALVGDSIKLNGSKEPAETTCPAGKHAFA
jgi:hypothetical protein